MKINKLLEEKIKNVMGLNLQALGSNTLKNSIARRMRSLQINDIEDYYNLVRRQKNELDELIDEIAINETWFFRDNAPFTALQKYAINWLKRGLGSSLRLLSIPCSTGEEPYSMAISLLELDIDEDLFSIDAIDISNRALAQAKRGIFGKRSFRGSNQVLQNQYFKKTKTGYAISKKVKHSVKFFQGNLLELKPLVPGFKYDIIFCRNLLIYLDKKSQKKAIANLDELLSPDGIIFSGHAEPGIFADTNFIPSSYPKAFALSKKAPISSGNYSVNSPKEDTKRFQRRDHDPMRTHTIVVAPLPPEVETPAALMSPDITAIQGLMADKHYNQAISLAEKFLKKNPPSPHIFFLLGQIFLKMDNLRQATKMLKKTVYLNPNSLEAIKLLATIYKQQGDEANSQIFEMRSQRVAMRLAVEKSC
jgi:chemotaxis protein methyltransferase WspC